MASIPTLFDYGSSPYSQKVHLFCAAAGITIKSCEQPFALPRPFLEGLGITYRRIPIMAIGKDVFADSSLILDVLQKNFRSKLSTSAADKAYEVFGNSLFQLALRLAPVAKMDPAFLKDRETIFCELRSARFNPSVIAALQTDSLTFTAEITRPDHDKQRASATAELRAVLDIFECQFLGNGKQWINGDEISMSDIHVAWVVRWLLQGFGMKDEPGFAKDDFPNTYAWFVDLIDRLPQKEAEKVSEDEVAKILASSPYFVEHLSSITPDPSGISVGESVSVETADATPGAHPQIGKLAGAAIDTVTIQLKNELRIHFPRRGIIASRDST